MTQTLTKTQRPPTGWPEWIGYAAAAWSLLYGAFGLYWALGGAGFPFGTGDAELMAEPEFAFKVSLLGLATPGVAGPIIAALGALGALAGVLMARGHRSGAARLLLPAYAWIIAVGLTVVVQDYRTLVVVAYTPVMLIAKPFFGWPPGVGWDALYRPERLNLLMLLLMGIVWALAAVAYRRKVNGDCGNCGRGGAARPSALQRWARPAVWTAFTIPFVYAVTRWAWALGLSLGIDPAFYQEGKEDGLWLAGAALATLGAIGAVLTLGLIQRWGEIFPRWMIGLRGKRVPPMLAVVPATLVSVLVASAGGMYIRIVVARGGVTASTWPLELPETLWVVWGAALFVAAMAYHQRRRGRCGTCGRG
ncbi:hypothetical protein [Glycomyces niveus]|uniref:NYN domain-containing protein n=1 Tax=Glycomyces niveus TaxID=2820287 RepID=A0ABS3TZL5_9ACTN|nr:hypothetical protein [Glycomyces sp. NEAU-S30]MBO3731962.1 hypothetical protein [Glycomyces sp. NEAU-S30]